MSSLTQVFLRRTAPTVAALGIVSVATAPLKAESFTGSVNVLNNQNYTVGTNGITIIPGDVPILNFVRSNNTWADTWWDWKMGADNKLRLGFSTVPQITLQNGAFGIGVDTPAARLHVNGTLRADNGMLDLRSGAKTADSWPFRIASTETSGWNELRINRTGASRTWSIQTSEEGISYPALALQSSGGYVGVGTYSPQYKLHVESSVAGAVGYFRNTKTWTGSEYSIRVSGYSDFGGLRLNGNDGSRALYSESQLGFGTNRKPITFETTIGEESMRIAASGNVGIGTTNPTNKLEVNGTIRTKEVIVETTGWSDYVFAPDYRLAPLSEVKAHIATQGHLPGIPSAAEVAGRGVSVGDMQAKLLAKMEEMTLHMIALSEKVDAQATRIAQLETENAALRQP